MFTIDNKLQDLQVKQRSIYKILYSMNSHPVATPEMSVEEARCYILFFSEGTNLSAFIGLYLPGNDRKFFYAYNSNPFPFEAAEDVENEARQFAEDMGFLLDEINVSGMAPEDRNHWIEDQYIFGYKQPELQEEEEPEPIDDVPEEVEEPEAKQEAARKPDKEEAPSKKEEPDRQDQPVASAPPQTAAPSIQEPVSPPIQEPVPPPPAPAQPAPSQTAAPSIQEPVPPPPAPAQPAPPQQQPAPANYPQAPGQPQHSYPGNYPQQGQPYAPPQPYPGYPQQGQPYAPPQPYPGYPQQGQPYMPPQPYPGYPQPMPPQYPPMQPAPELDVPELEEPEAPARAKTGKQRPAEKTKRPAFRPPPPSSRRPVREEEEEEELTTEVESETTPIRPPQRAAETTRPVAGKKPILRTTASAPGSAGTVTRDKEALARLLSSF